MTDEEFATVNGERVTKEQWDQHCAAMKELNELLRNHDYFHAYSDDHRVYLRGQASWDTIQRKVKEIGKDAVTLRDAWYKVKFGPHTGFEYWSG